MSAPRLRRRALTITAALAGTVGLTLAGVGPATAATPPASTASSAVSSRVTAALHESAVGTIASRAAVARALSTAGLKSSAARSSATTPSAVTPAPAGAIPAAKIDPNADPDGVIGSAVLGDEYYGAGSDWNGEASDLEHWTKFGWKPVEGSPAEIDSQVVTAGDAVYFTVTTYSRSFNPTATLWSYDGTTFSALKKFSDSSVNLTAAGSTLTIVENPYFEDDDESNTATVTQYDGTTFTTPYTTNKYLYSPLSIGDTQYYLVESQTTYATAIYRVGATGLTRVSSSPYEYAGVELNGAYYFGGISAKGDAVGIYKFDGTATPTPVKVGVSFAKATAVPSVGAYDGDLYFTTTTGEKTPTLYSFDGTTTASAGPIGSAGDLFGLFQEFGSKLFYTGGGYYDISSSIYDKNATAGTVVESSVPTITGTPTVGKVLTAVGGDWTPTAKLSYQWYSDGKAVKGATKVRHRVTVAEFGHTLSVRVTGSGPGFVSATQLSAATAKPALGTMYLDPEIVGRERAGSTLTVDMFELTPRTAKLTYRWYRNGTPIIGATKKTYKATSGDVGKQVTVAVHASNPGYKDGAESSYPSTIRAK